MEYKLSSLSKRFGALIIDGIIISIIAKLCSFPFGFSFTPWNDFGSGFHFWQFAEYSTWTGFIGFLYYSIMESSTRSATFGKQAMHIKVFDEDGNNLNLAKAMVRNLIKVICGSTFIFGFIVASFTKNKQALHDLLAGTVVVEEAPELESAL